MTDPLRLLKGMILVLLLTAVGPSVAQTPSGQRLIVDVTGGISQPMPIAIPVMPTPAQASTAAGDTVALGSRIAEVITADLKGSGLFTPLGPGSLRPVAMPQVAAPDFIFWTTTGAQALVQGSVRANANGSLTVGCYLYDVYAKSLMLQQEFTFGAQFWRRAAHKCADVVYSRLTGEGPYFDSRVVYVSETGPKNRRIKRLAIMDQDGASHRFLSNGQNLVLTPRYAPNQQTVTYMGYVNKQPRVFIYSLGSGRARPLVSQPYMTFSPRFSPDSRYVIFSMSVGGNTDLYRVPTAGGTPVRLTTAPGIDTAASYSPDGSRIVFESDRGGTQQLYVMNADGSNQRRISFGGGRYATPVWSPRGDVIAFTKIGGGFNIGIMRPDGGGEKILSDGWQDEGPSWSPNGRVIIFFRTARGSGRADLFSVDLTGVNTRKIPTPLDGSDPSWSPLLP